MNAEHVREYVIRPTLKALDLWSKSAENLLLGTAAQESKMGYYLKQVRGPALGMYQIEPKTHTDVQVNFLAYRPALAHEIMKMAFSGLSFEYQLQCNLAYSTAIARVIYMRVPTPLPEFDDVRGMASYWKNHYNTKWGRGTEDEFIKNYMELVG